MHLSKSAHKMRKAMGYSLLVGAALLVLKLTAFILTDSSAVLSDAAESIVHLFAVGFAAYSLRLSQKPADLDHPYGHDRITFFSAGFEGALIACAAVYIIYEAIQRWITGVTVQNIDWGLSFVLGATFLSGGLGWYLVNLAKKHRSLVLEADGKHLLTDCLTSLGVVASLILTKFTDWAFLDPLLALAIAANILWTGSKLMINAIKGLMDQSDPQMDNQLKDFLSDRTKELGISYHHLRHRNTGSRLLVEVHLQFPQEWTITHAHAIATDLEREMERDFSYPLELFTHLEPVEGHDEIHQTLLGRAEF